MRLPRPAPAYDAADQAQTRGAIERADAENFKRDGDIQMRNGRLILFSPNGSAFRLTVSDTGLLGTAPL
jgi:hypothetical protein